MEFNSFARMHAGKALNIVKNAQMLECSILSLLMEDMSSSGRIYLPERVAQSALIVCSHLLWQTVYKDLPADLLILSVDAYIYKRHPDYDAAAAKSVCEEILVSLDTFESIVANKLEPHFPHAASSNKRDEFDWKVPAIWLIEHSLDAPAPVFDAVLTSMVFSEIAKWLESVLSGKQAPNSSSSPNPVKNKNKTRSWLIGICAVIFSIVIISSIVSRTSPSSTTHPSQISTTSAPSPSPTPEEVQFPANGTITLSSGRIVDQDDSAPFEIKTDSSDRYYYVVLQNTSRSCDKCYIYVHGGKTIEVNVPLGSYKMYYACGDHWYGRELRFLNSGGDYVADDIFNFRADNYYSYGFTVTLYAVRGGNLDMEPVDASDFPS